jgi:hypothetical protein
MHRLSLHRLLEPLLLWGVLMRPLMQCRQRLRYLQWLLMRMAAPPWQPDPLE